jgi:hypothetical protein
LDVKVGAPSAQLGRWASCRVLKVGRLLLEDHPDLGLWTFAAFFGTINIRERR